MEDNREKWIQPQLIVLGRGTPEENVLAGCKTSKFAAKNATLKSCLKKTNTWSCASGKCAVVTSPS
jgi:hypothetical protein